MEWCILHFITGFISPYSLYVYTNNNYTDNYLLYICIISILISLIAAAKARMFNIFRTIRLIPKIIKNEITFQIKDYKHWKLTGERIDQSSRKE